jgi:hypothetical protein
MRAVHPHDQISNPDLGTENGYCGSDQFLIHAVNHGTREGKWVPTLAVTRPTVHLGVFSRQPNKSARAYVI